MTYLKNILILLTISMLYGCSPIETSRPPKEIKNWTPKVVILYGTITKGKFMFEVAHEYSQAVEITTENGITMTEIIGVLNSDARKSYKFEKGERVKYEKITYEGEEPYYVLVPLKSDSK